MSLHQSLNNGQSSLDPYLPFEHHENEMALNLGQNSQQLINQIQKQPFQPLNQTKLKEPKKYTSISPYDSKWTSDVLRVHYKIKLKEIPNALFHVQNKWRVLKTNNLKSNSNRQSHCNSNQRVRIKKSLNKTSYNSNTAHIPSLAQNPETINQINQSFDVGASRDTTNQNQAKISDS